MRLSNAHMHAQPSDVCLPLRQLLSCSPTAWLVCKHGNLFLTGLQAATETTAATYPGSPEWALFLAHGHLPRVLVWGVEQALRGLSLKGTNPIPGVPP